MIRCGEVSVRWDLAFQFKSGKADEMRLLSFQNNEGVAL